MQKMVTEKFVEQIAKYKTVRKYVCFVFSQQPPDWVINAINGAGGTYIVHP